MSGWAADTADPIASVAVYLDGVSKGNATYGITRTDVCAAGGAFPGCPNVGWSMPLDTALLAAGNHTLQITATTTDGRATSASRTFSVTAPMTPMSIDVPVPTGSGTYLGGITTAGWAADTADPIASVAIYLDGALKGNATYGISRTDVCAAGGQFPGCPNVGWSMPLDTALLSAGNHTLQIIATTSDGRATSASRTFSVTAAQTLYSIDSPVPGGAYPSTVTFSGWAIDSGYPIASVAVTLDGAAKGNATYGVSRPDVCAAGSYPGCPNVGWSFGYGPLSNGTHTFAITVVTADGRTLAPGSVSFEVIGAVSTATAKKEYIYFNGKVVAIENHP